MKSLYALGAMVLAVLLAQPATEAAIRFLPKPDVTVSLVDLAEPTILIGNGTQLEAKGIGYSFVLWNLDNPADARPPPVRDGILSGLAPGETSAPVALFEAPENRAAPKRGDRIVGAVGIHCGNCARGHGYRFYIAYGEGGWFAEIPDVTDGALLAPSSFHWDFLSHDRLQAGLIAWVNQIAVRHRTPIGPGTK